MPPVAGDAARNLPVHAAWVEPGCDGPWRAGAAVAMLGHALADTCATLIHIWGICSCIDSDLLC